MWCLGNGGRYPNFPKWADCYRKRSYYPGTAGRNHDPFDYQPSVSGCNKSKPNGPCSWWQADYGIWFPPCTGLWCSNSGCKSDLYRWMRRNCLCYHRPWLWCSCGWNHGTQLGTDVWQRVWSIPLLCRNLSRWLYLAYWYLQCFKIRYSKRNQSIWWSGSSKGISSEGRPYRQRRYCVPVQKSKKNAGCSRIFRC